MRPQQLIARGCAAVTGPAEQINIQQTPGEHDRSTLMRRKGKDLFESSQKLFSGCFGFLPKRPAETHFCPVSLIIQCWESYPEQSLPPRLHHPESLKASLMSLYSTLDPMTLK
ncbi:hypothetical protein DNTS_004043 [Danionella cerebrum]|uniref:Uncharacterized protein n=1 Tax=Danionella cerebrum TaxID=2873325 RepID=A0A553RIE5_9TELE|nr:hypothetical protein DNTS_004043 [Danionella translucida]